MSHDINWEASEFQIRDFLEKTIDADHIGWEEEEILCDQDIPLFMTEASTSEVLDNIPLNRTGLKQITAVMIECNDGECFILFDEKPKGSVVSDSDYKKGIESKIEDISEYLRGYVLVRKMINDDGVTRIIWTAAK
jgi:hypothetical protein